MKHVELYKIANSLTEAEQGHWKERFMLSMKPGFQYPCGIPFEGFLFALSIKGKEILSGSNQSVTAYGAGNMAKAFLPEIQEYVKVDEVWDAYVNLDSLYGIPIVKPRQKVSPEATVVVFIDDRRSRNDVILGLEEKGCQEIFYYKEFMQVMTALPHIEYIAEHTAEETWRLFEEFAQQYEVIHDGRIPVNYSVIPRKFHMERLEFCKGKNSEKELLDSLAGVLLLNPAAKKRAEDLVAKFLSEDIENAFSFAYKIEIFLRGLLAEGIKTAERPIRMFNDTPYDRFAILEAIQKILSCLCESCEQKLSAVRFLRICSPDSIPLISAECFCLKEYGKYEQAIQMARQGMKKDPNDLLANETFYQITAEYKKMGGFVEENLPEYDLNERFCWSGFTFALCPGFDKKNEKAQFLPCFRTLQCAANPAGDFWSGEEWKEFRKSILDGSFKYCQKNQCSNLVAGWLPRKKDCVHEDIKKMIEGDDLVIPPLEELHFSYDSHCNLKCPSCRLEIKTNTKEETEELDALYEKNLKPLVKAAKHLCLSGCGEAMLSPHSRKILQSLSREEYPELSVELRTNVTSFSPQMWDGLGEGRKLIRHVAASIDSASKEGFERLRYPARWETVLKNLEFIQSLRNKGEIDLFEFHVVIQSENLEELSDIARMAIQYDADAVTYSRLVNWRGMSEEEYQDVNPFWSDHPKHRRLIQALDELKELRDSIEAGQCELTKGKKKTFINIHFYPDPNTGYDVIRNGRLKIR